MTRHLTILTDCTDVAATEIRYSVISNLKNSALAAYIEPTVSIEPMCVANGAFLNRLVAEVCPEGTVLYTVLNPVQSQPKRIIGITEKKNLIFLGRDTGAFGWLIQDFGCKKLYEISSQSYIPFGGKNVYPAVAAKLLEGTELQNLGLEEFPPVVTKLDLPKGTVVHIDNFGICKTFSRLDETGLKTGQTLQLYVNGNYRCDCLYNPRIMAEKDGTIIICTGSSLGGLAEIAQTRQNFAYNQKIKVGDAIDVRNLDNSVLTHAL